MALIVAEEEAEKGGGGFGMLDYVAVSPGGAQGLIGVVDAPVISALQRASIEKFIVTTNSLGEAVLQWLVYDPRNNVETCLIIATFNGVTAPLGAVPSLPGQVNYEFADRVLNAYVGKKVYTIVFVYYDGSVSVGDKVARTVKNSNIPLRYLE